MHRGLQAQQQRVSVPLDKKKDTCPDVVVDVNGKGQGSKYYRVTSEPLGKGGFAICYSFEDANGSPLAVKVVTEASLAAKDKPNKTNKHREKLASEIAIHRTLDHQNVVRLKKTFTDRSNTYLVMQRCDNGTMSQYVRQRRRLTEPEARYYAMSLIQGVQYLHENRVVHRDLKLSNLFLTDNMVLKIGDFGLASMLSEPGERRRTMCGTPNYIAPEVITTHLYKT
ncbi:hypothetical protein KIPB_003968, partial [Kipferlia bialata]|eukprot:g3968.t1